MRFSGLIWGFLRLIILGCDPLLFNTQENNLDRAPVLVRTPNQFPRLHTTGKAPKAAFSPLPAGFPFPHHPMRGLASRHSCPRPFLLPLLCCVTPFYRDLPPKFWSVKTREASTESQALYHSLGSGQLLMRPQKYRMQGLHLCKCPRVRECAREKEP